MVSPANPEPDAIARAADALAHGGLVVFPTDTFYGLAADPRQAGAVTRVFAVKGRAAGEALPLVAADLSQVEAAAAHLSVLTRRLIGLFWPGPLTLVVDAAPAIVSAVHGGTGTVAVRVPDHAVARRLAAGLGFAVVSTSANRSRMAPAVTADEVERAIGDLVDVVLDGGPTVGGKPSTIVDARTETPRLLRDGAVPFARVLEVL